MAETKQRLDFDATGESGAKALVQESFRLSHNALAARRGQWRKDYKLVNSFIEATDRNPDRANTFIPKLWSIVRTKAPRDVKSLVGKRPYLPFTVQDRPEFEESVAATEAVVDDILHKAFYAIKMMLLALLKTVYGTAFMEFTPFLETVNSSQLQPDEFGRLRNVSVPEKRLRGKLRAYGPWDVYPDAHAIGLEERDACRYLLKRDFVSKRSVVRGYHEGLYPGLDLEKFQTVVKDRRTDFTDSTIGADMIASIGHVLGELDEDMGIMMRYESPDRYIDMFIESGGEANEIVGTVLRDTDNPFPHKKINLSRWIHDFDAHTKNQFWGIGEIRPNEHQQLMLNDLYNMAIDSHMMMNMPTVYHDTATPASALVRTIGNSVKVKIKDGRPVRDHIFESPGTGLPPEHFGLMDRTERNMDLSSGQFAPGRGESEEGSQTASEILTLRSEGAERQEMNVRQGESLFLEDFGSKTIETVKATATADDIIEVVGLERASRAALVSPQDLPGAFNFMFKGSDRVVDHLVRQRNMKELAPVLLSIPNVSPAWVATMLLELHDIPKRDIERGVIPDELMTMITLAAQQFQSAEAQEATQAAHDNSIEAATLNAALRAPGSERGGAGQTGRGGQGGRRAINSPAQLQQQNSSQLVRANNGTR